MPPTFISVSVLVVEPNGSPLLLRHGPKSVANMPFRAVSEGEDPQDSAILALAQTGLRAHCNNMLPLFSQSYVNEDGQVCTLKTFFAIRWTGDFSSAEAGVTPFWGSWSELFEKSVISACHRKMAQEGYITYLTRVKVWSPETEDQVAAVMAAIGSEAEQ
jgi:hypothetical protein